MPSNFAITSAKYLLLTYSQVDRGHEDKPENERPSFTLPGSILLHVQAIRGGAECVIGRESHRDGGRHLHVFVSFKKRFSTRNSRCFDVEGYHPNIERVGRTPWKAYDYAIKDNDRCGGECERPEEGGCDIGPPKRDQDWTWITDAPTRDEFFVRIRQRRPRELVCNISQILKYADWQYREDPAEYRHPENVHFELDSFPEVTQWAWDNLGRLGGGRSSSPDWPARGLSEQTEGDDPELGETSGGSQGGEAEAGGWAWVGHDGPLR